MKIFLFGVVLFLTAEAFCSTGPLIVKQNFPGMTPPEWARYEKCEVFANEVVITKTYMGRDFVYRIALEETDLLKFLIDSASVEEQYEEENNLCDAPSTVITAFNYSDTGSNRINLYATGGCGAMSIKRDGPYSSAVVDIVDSFCPKTY